MIVGKGRTICKKIALPLFILVTEIGQAAPPSSGSELNPVVSASALLASAPGTPSGIYWLDPDGYGGTAAFQVYMDMTTGGGGWMLALNSVTGAEPAATSIISNTGTVGLTTAQTRALSSYSGQVRHQILSTSGNVDGYYFGSYPGSGLPASGWTFFETGNLGLISPNMGQVYASQGALGGASWYGSGGTVPTNAVNGFTQGPQNGSGYPVSRYSVWIRGSSSIPFAATQWLTAESAGWDSTANWYGATRPGANVTANFTASGTYTITFASSGTAKGIKVAGGDVIMALATKVLNVGSDGLLIDSGATLIVNSGTVVNSGSTSVAVGGVLQGASATLGGDAYIAGHLAPGAMVGPIPGEGSKGLLNFSAKLALSGTTTMEIGGEGLRGSAYDAISVGDSLSYGGALRVFFDSDVSYGTFNLFDFGSLLANNFNAVNFFGVDDGLVTLTLAPLERRWTGEGENGRTYIFNETTGDVAVVPEPGSLALVGVTLAGFLLRRRRPHQ